METHNETTRPGVMENNERPGSRDTGTPNKGQDTQLGQSSSHQERIDDWLSPTPIPSIDAMGDPPRLILDGEEMDGILRVSF